MKNERRNNSLTFNIATWNVDGMRQSVFRDVVSGLIFQNVDLDFITETRMNSSLYSREVMGYGIFATEYPSKLKGVSLLWRKNMRWRIEDVMMEEEGNGLFSMLANDKLRINLLVFCAPPSDSIQS